MASAKPVTPFPLISHLRFLTRPDNSTRPQRPIRDTLGIQHPAVLDLCHTRLWESISQSLDGPPHDRNTCHCYCGKGMPIDHLATGRCFVLLICGNLYEESSPGKSRAWYVFNCCGPSHNWQTNICRFLSSFLRTKLYLSPHNRLQTLLSTFLLFDDQ